MQQMPQQEEAIIVTNQRSIPEGVLGLISAATGNVSKIKKVAARDGETITYGFLS